MSSNIQVPSSSTPNFQSIFEKALEEYKKKTGNDLAAHPLAAEINDCDSPESILAVLEGKANELNQSRSSNDRLTKWLNPTVNILNALSATLGESAGSVFPPTKIIFSGIGILLVAAKSTVASRDVLVELFDRTESFFRRLKTYTEVPPTQAVMDVLVKIMAEVLSILAIATKGVKERRTKTILKKLAGMNDIEDALQRLRKLEQGELLTMIAQVSRDTSGLKDDADETKAMINKIADKMDARDLEEVLQKLKGWLSPPDPSTNYVIGLRDLHEETATWFLEGHIFQEWHSAGSLLWIHGKPGSGKSILCSAIIQRILSLCHGERASVAYFYFDFRDENKKHRHNLLPSLLIQFAAHSIFCCDMMSRVYSAHGKGTRQPSDDVLINCLTDMLSATTQHPIYIILDALDECPNTFGVRSPRDRVLSLVKGLLDLDLSNLHICVTSRPEVDIRIRLEPLTSRRVSLHDQAGHKEDIAKYISREVDVLADHKRWREGDKELVIETLSEKADGMFRWVYCQLEMLRLCLRSRVRHFINELPDSLDETYERALKEIHKTNQVYAQRLLQCLTVAIRPLRVDELAAILTFDADAIEEEVPTLDADWWSEDQEQELLSACPSLITIVGRHGSRVVQFSHFSVKEFLTSDRLSASSEDMLCYHVLPKVAHTTLAQGSLGVLLRLDGRVDTRGAGRGIQTIPLVGYAAEHWVSHVQAGSVSSHMMGRMKTLFDPDKPYFAAWVQIYDIDRQPYWYTPRETAKPLYYSALCGFCDLVEHLAKKHPQHVNDFGGSHDYPLVAALHGGYIRAAELLFRLGANVDGRGTEWTPLHIVCRWHHDLVVGAVRFLLTHGADVNPQREHLSTPLHLVLRNCLASCIPELMRMLLDHGADVNTEENFGRTPLHRVLGDKNLVSYIPELMRMLLDHGANVNTEDNFGRTPLHRMLEAKGYSDKDKFGVAQLFVERGADVNARDQHHGTPLHWASYFPELMSVRMLIDHGADVNAKDKRGQTPFHRVSQSESYSDKGRLEVAQLLVELGADVNERDEDHETPLHLASYCPELRFVRMLVDYGAEVNAKDKRGRTPLYRVLGDRYNSDEDRFGVAQLLLEHGADANTPDNYLEAPLHLASRLVSLDLAWILLKNGADLNVEDIEGKIPFQLARERMREEMERPPFEYSIRRAQRVQGVALMGLLYTDAIRSQPM
ncbi:ankyrin repeat-containing domain protein [Lactarius deliciosus]|nr:ankyrin repeat-containing domain protein [Lactarius deliciosus]